MMGANALDTSCSARSRLDLVAHRIAAECLDLATSTDALQATIGRWVETGAIELDPITIQRLQDSDRMSQTLHCLARVMARIAPELADKDVDSLELQADVGLESVARRLLSD